MMQICDNLFRAESLSNYSDPELKRMAYTGAKQVIAGAIDEISNTFSYSSPTMKAYAQNFVTGLESVANKNFTL